MVAAGLVDILESFCCLTLLVVGLLLAWLGGAIVRAPSVPSLADRRSPTADSSPPNRNTR